MKWIARSPIFGDIIRVKIGVLYHYGIFVDEGEVIQFGLAPIARPNIPDSEIEVCSSDIAVFACGQTVEVGECENETEIAKRRSPALTVEAARASLGEKGYSILHNNCEHFAYKCATGERFCMQTLNVRELFKNFPIVDVYILVEKSADTERALVEYAINRSFGKKPLDAALSHNDGAWESSICKIAVARFDSLITVCVSRGEIGLELVPFCDETTISDGIWCKNLESYGIKHAISLKTATPQKVRLYNSLNIEI